MLFYGVFGVILGGRLGYVLFYKPLYYLAHPLEIFQVWAGGMSFHGGFLGVLVALWLFARSRDKRWLDVTDFVAPLVPLGLAAGASATSSTASSSGRATDVPWAMVFPQVDSVPRHPSQLYQFGARGRAAVRAAVVVLGAAAAGGRGVGLVPVGYGTFRFIAEFAREPDNFLGLPRRRPDDGPVAVAADDRRRPRDDAVGLPARRQGAADDHRPDEVSVGGAQSIAADNLRRCASVIRRRWRRIAPRGAPRCG